MTSPSPAMVAFLSDFGLRDAYTAEVHGVLAREAPELRVIDVTHLVPPGDVRTGAFLLKRVRPSFPLGTVFLAVVDPGVGTARRPVVVRDPGGFLVGPDNGLLGWAARPEAEWRLIAPSAGAPQPSRTFHGRDLFAPIAAGLATGLRRFETMGPRVPNPVSLPFPGWTFLEGRMRGEVLHVDAFGNLLVSIPQEPFRSEFPEGCPLRVHCWGGTHPAMHGVYGDSQGLTVHPDSSGYLEISLFGRSAAAMLHLSPGDSVEVTR